MLSPRGKTSAPDVPAARRTLAALEELARRPRGARPAELTRALGSSPSSMHALLATLADGGFVVRDEIGRYRLGPRWAVLAGSGARPADPVEDFQPVGAQLASELGETVLLWRVEADAAVLVAAREGWRSLRFVPRLGERVVPLGAPLEAALAEAEPHAVSVVELDRGVAMAVAPVERAGPAERWALAVAGPTDRVRLPEVAVALRMAARRLSAVGDVSTPALDRLPTAGPLSAAELNRFLAQPLIASLAYLNEDGYPSAVPVRYDWDGHRFWLLPEPGARWAAQLRHCPHVSLTVSEVSAPLRRVNAEALATPVTSAQRVRALDARLRARYAASGVASADWPGSGRHAMRLDPTRLLSSRGLGGRARARGVA